MDQIVALHNPFSHPLHFLALELAMGAAFALTLAHALREKRRGDGWPLFQWLTAFFYGVIIELVTYSVWDNFNHAQFSVQLYRHKLPLYVTLVYPAFHYAGIKLAESWRLPRLASALVTGLCIMLLDVPFDIAGPDAGWWIWSTKDPNMAVRWLGVPVTSYYWYLIFGAIYAGLLGLLRPRLQGGSMRLLLTPLVGLAVLVLGVLGFLPFHLIKALGVPAGAIVAAHIAVVAVIAWRLRPTSVDLAPLIRAAAFVIQLYPLLVFASLGPLLWAQKAAAIGAALVGVLFFSGRSTRGNEAAALPATGVDAH
jgi:hypothetical protein